MIYLRLFYEFFKTGLFAVGGGLATLPFLNDMADTTGWFTRADLADMIAVSESTPGPIGVNMATYAGFTTAGIPGALIATLGLILPSLIIILIIAGFLKKFSENRLVKAVFSGLRPASVALISAVLLSLVQMNFFLADASPASVLGAFKWKALALGAAAFVAIRFFKKIHPAVFLLAGAVIGILLEL